MYCYTSYDISLLGSDESAGDTISSILITDGERTYLSDAFFDPPPGECDFAKKPAKCDYDGSRSLSVIETENTGIFNCARMAKETGYSLSVHEEFHISTDGDMNHGGHFYTVNPDGTISGQSEIYFDPNKNKWFEKRYTIKEVPDR